MKHILALLCAVGSSTAYAQLPDSSQANVELVDVNSAISASLEPQSPTFQMIGVATDDVSRPSSPGKLAVGLLNSLDQNGNFQTGLAIEFRPYLLFRQSRLRLSQYRSNATIRQLSNIQIALGVAKGANKEDPSVKAALGLIWTPINGLDENRASPLGNCLSQTVGGVLSPGAPPEDVAKKQAEQKAAIAACYKSHPLLPDNTTKLQFNFSPLFISPSGKTEDLKAKGYHAGAIFSLGLTKTSKLVADPKATRSLLVFAAAYRKNEITPDPTVTGSFVDRNRLSVGARAIIGRPDFVLLSVQAFYQRARFRSGGRDNYATYTAGLDIPIPGQKMWLNLSAGTSSGRSFSKDSTFVGGGLKFSLGQSAESLAKF